MLPWMIKKYIGYRSRERQLKMLKSLAFRLRVRLETTDCKTLDFLTADLEELSMELGLKLPDVNLQTLMAVVSARKVNGQDLIKYIKPHLHAVTPWDIEMPNACMHSLRQWVIGFDFNNPAYIPVAKTLLDIAIDSLEANLHTNPRRGGPIWSWPVKIYTPLRHPDGTAKQY